MVANPSSCCGSIHSNYPHLFNPLNAKLNPICYLLALLGAHHFLHVNRIRVKLFIVQQISVPNISIFSTAYIQNFIGKTKLVDGCCTSVFPCQYHISTIHNQPSTILTNDSVIQYNTLLLTRYPSLWFGICYVAKML